MLVVRRNLVGSGNGDWSSSVFVRLKQWMKSPVSWGAVLLSYVGIVGAVAYGASVGAYTDQQLAHEAHVREEQICRVVINVHNNAKFRANTEQQRVVGTVDYLTDPDVPRDALYERVRQNLKQVRVDRDVAKANVTATTPPPICRKYQPR